MPRQPRQIGIPLLLVQFACAAEGVAEARSSGDQPSSVPSATQSVPPALQLAPLAVQLVAPAAQPVAPALQPATTPAVDAAVLPQLQPVPPASEPAAGTASGQCAIPVEAQPEDTSQPDQIVGDGTAASCTAQAFIDAVARGGKIRFACGPSPVVITLDRPAKVVNDASDEVVIDGGNLVTLSGGGTTRILYMNTCDAAQHWTSSHCDDQATPRLTVQNLTLVNGNSSTEAEEDGGGAIFVRGGRFKVLHSRFFNNTCIETGPDVGGAAIRAFSQYQNLPVYVVDSTFGGADGYGNACANGGGIGSIGVNWTIIDSVFSFNRATGFGGNPAAAGTPGGGSGGAIYNDGDSLALSICGSRIEHNQVRAYGSGIFFVSNTHDATLRIDNSVISGNQGGSWNVQPGVSMHEDTVWSETGSLLE